ncbi:class I SAM-dependent methyltransferase [Pelagicoccus sp. SDUM812005]|uniref:class I SAM-dependent methyltransferase n=1 Tax=Pelagicoccus sp. SDUM812005 TaxID=3041257 RepID=UPI00280F3C6C|nr:class I SAM-dependent methyltransferase [Pelagicoccus sp. SDUM812005]MDQ8183728.1 class I SAM-dependent methyltransferase [Pelagicoccus sp. SDUM812005]
MENSSGNQISKTRYGHIPGKSHYGKSYLASRRIFSYAHQLSVISQYDADSILEIGPGPGLVTQALRLEKYRVTTVDVQPELNPDIAASVLNLPLDDSSFDLGLCCQVLEHLPFQKFTDALSELHRVTRCGLVLSLPDSSRSFSLSGQIPFFGRFSFQVAIPTIPPPPFPESKLESMGHYWEIGFKGTTLSSVKQAITSSGFRIKRSWRVNELPWHRFFELTK